MLSTWKLVASVQPTKQQLVDYANAAAAVNLYAYAITNQNMPVLNQPPNNYGNFAASFSPAKAHCLDWTNSIFPNILSFPTTIVQANNLFSLEGSEIGAALSILQTDPTNAQAKTVLANALTAVQQIVRAQLTVGQQLVSNLNTFSTNITADATTLSTIAAQALADAGADQTTINTLNQDIQNLNSDISSLQTWLTVSEIGIGLSIFVGLIGAVVCLIPGAQGVGIGLIVLAVAGEAASIAGTVIATKKIAADQQMITNEKAQITQLNQDIILLQGLNTQFKYLVTANQNAQQAMATVVQMWQNLDTTISAVITELTAVGTDVTAAHYLQAQTDLQAANTAWQQVVEFAQALAGVNYQWIDANGQTHNFGQQSPGVNAGQVTNISSSAYVGSSRAATR